MGMEKAKGITLIEILVAMAILSVIAAIAIPAYRGYISTAHKTECQNEVASLKLAESEFFLENNYYFNGTGASTLVTKSNGTYNPSADILSSTKSECVYIVQSVDVKKDFTIIANHNTAGGHLGKEKDPIVTFTGP